MGAMRKRDVTVRRAISLAALGAVIAGASAAHAAKARFGVAKADGEDIGFALQTEVECSALSHAGKVQCVVRLRPVGGTLHFSDAIVLAAPDFAPPVRDRAGADLPLTLSASSDGDGELYVMGRATVCSDRGCRPVQGAASARVVVGASSRAH